MQDTRYLFAEMQSLYYATLPNGPKGSGLSSSLNDMSYCFISVDHYTILYLKNICDIALYFHALCTIEFYGLKILLAIHIRRKPRSGFPYDQCWEKTLSCLAIVFVYDIFVWSIARSLSHREQHMGHIKAEHFGRKSRNMDHLLESSQRGIKPHWCYKL